MKDSWRQVIHKPVNYYVAVMLVLAVACVWWLAGADFTLPGPLIWAIGSACLLLVWQCGVQFPYLGMISMERVVQFHLLLTLPISETLMISTVASLIMPFINKSYRMNSYYVALLRAANNLAMNTLMLLAGFLILRHWLDLPVMILDGQVLLILAITAVVMQVINIAMIYVYFSFDQKKVHHLFTPAYLFADFVFVPVGVLSAILWQTTDFATFGLFVFFMVVLLLSFHAFNRQDQGEESLYLNKGTDFQASYLDLSQVCAAIQKRCDQLFNCQGLYLVAKDEGQEQSLIAHNNTQFSGLHGHQNQLMPKEGINKGTSQIGEHTIHHMQASFIDQQGEFARILMIRDSQTPFMEADLNLLRLFVQRYRPGLSYALTYERLDEYKNDLEAKVAERTHQLEAANEEKSVLVNRLKKISKTDALTGLHNRRYFDALMRHLGQNVPEALSLAVLDIDHFKQINDQHGHDMGDWVLQEMTRLMQDWSGKGSTLARYGGEEFVILMSGTGPDQASSALEKLRAHIESHDWGATELKQIVTVSIGVAHHPDVAFDDLFEHADAALYRAKTAGRNRLHESEREISG